MGIGISIFFLAAGAILTFAVDATVSGIDLEVVGVILMVIGGVGLAVSLIWADAFWRRGTRDTRDDVVVEERRVPR